MSKIEWTEKTWNPITGCIKVSPGCKNCYAETIAKRLKRMGVDGYSRGFEPSLHLKRLLEPGRRKVPTMYFVCSMSDLFQNFVSFNIIDDIMRVCWATPQHTYQVLTKRPIRMRQYFSTRHIPPNVWLGVSVENQKHGLPRIDVLRHITAPVRFLSCEPLLEDLGPFVDLSGIHWVICGGESGYKARMMRPVWARHLRNRCHDLSIPFFMKQMTKKQPIPEDLFIRQFPKTKEEAA